MNVNQPLPDFPVPGTAVRVNAMCPGFVETQSISCDRNAEDEKE